VKTWITTACPESFTLLLLSNLSIPPGMPGGVSREVHVWLLSAGLARKVLNSVKTPSDKAGGIFKELLPSQLATNLRPPGQAGGMFRVLTSLFDAWDQPPWFGSPVFQLETGQARTQGVAWHLRKTSMRRASGEVFCAMQSRVVIS
jgi:hypothetical protein